MTTLTEDIVRQRLRNYSAPLELVTKINITGRDLEDISLVQQMTAIEILSLSVNKIKTLYDLQFCTNLKELYLRKNNIHNLNEIFYLTELPNLTVLGLSQNPCSNEPDYRITVIKNLTKLEKLDDVPVVPEERVVAFKKGRKIRHPIEDAQEESNTSSNYMTEKTEEPKPAAPSSEVPPEKPADWEQQQQQQQQTPPPPPQQQQQQQQQHQVQTPAPRVLSPIGKPRSECKPDFRYGDPSPERTFDPEKLKNGNPNLINGIMTLIKDLDYTNLEILSVNIKNRLAELQRTNGFQ